MNLITAGRVGSVKALILAINFSSRRIRIGIMASILMSLAWGITGLPHAAHADSSCGSGYYCLPVQKGVMTDSSNYKVGEYGTSSEYEWALPNSDPHPAFYTGVEAVASPSGTWDYYGVSNLHITVSITDPTGAAVPGGQINVDEASLSPDSSSSNLKTILSFIYNAMLNALPYGIGSDIQNSVSNGGTSSGTPGNTGYANWSTCSDVACYGDPQHGLYLKWHFNIGGGIAGGTYIISIHYHVEITHCKFDFFYGCAPNDKPVTSQDLYDTYFYCNNWCSGIGLGAGGPTDTLIAGAPATDLRLTITTSLSPLILPQYPMTMSATSNDPAITTALNPTAIQITTNGPADHPRPPSGVGDAFVSLAANNCKPGTFTLTLSAQGQGLSVSVDLQILEPCDFTMAASQPNPSTIAAGGSSTSTVTLNGQGLSGNVQLSSSITAPSCSVCPTITFSPNPLPLSTPGSGTSTITISTSAATTTGSYSATIRGTGSTGGISHSTSVAFQVTGALTFSYSSLYVPADGSSSSTITVQTSDSQPNIVVTFSTNFGALSSTSCTTGSGGACTTTIASAATGFATITASSQYYTSTPTHIYFTDFNMFTTTLALDGSASSFCGASTSSCVTRISTTRSNDVIIVYAVEAENSRQQTICSFQISDASGLHWALRNFAWGRNDGSTGAPRDEIYEYWAVSSNVLSNDFVFETISGCGNNYNGLQVFAISGANTQSPFDTNGYASGAGAGQNGIPFASVSTTSSNDMIVGAGLESSSPNSQPPLGTGSGFIQIRLAWTSDASATQATEYGFYNSPQNGLAVWFFNPTNGWWEALADSIVAAPPSTLTPGTSSSFSIIVNSVNGFSGTVSLSDTPPAGVTCGSLNPPSLNVVSSSPSLATVSCTTANGGGYSVLVKATSQNLSHTTNMGPPDFTICCQQSYSLPQGGAQMYAGVSVTSVNGFAGTVTLFVSPTTAGNSPISLSPTSLNVSPGVYAATTLSITSGSQTGTWTFTITVQIGGATHAITDTVTINPCCSGGGGSVAAGTMITLADGSQVPAENLKPGMQLLSYDMSTQQFVKTTITVFTMVPVHNLMTITTADGRSLTTDQNPAQKLYAMLPDGSWKLVSVTDLKVGYMLFDPFVDKWIPITHIHYKDHRNSIMYDIYTTSPGNYIANGYLDPLKM